MAISGKYGKLEIPGVGSDEPVFILRAQDKLAQGLIEIYRILVGSHGGAMAGKLDGEIKKFQA